MVCADRNLHAFRANPAHCSCPAHPVESAPRRLAVSALRRPRAGLPPRRCRLLLRGMPQALRKGAEETDGLPHFQMP